MENSDGLMQSPVSSRNKSLAKSIKNYSFVPSINAGATVWWHQNGTSIQFRVKTNIPLSLSRKPNQQRPSSHFPDPPEMRQNPTTTGSVPLVVSDICRFFVYFSSAVIIRRHPGRGCTLSEKDEVVWCPRAVLAGRSQSNVFHFIMNDDSGPNGDLSDPVKAAEL